MMKIGAIPGETLQWMIAVGVGADDVLWLDTMLGSIESHMDDNRARIEAIYTSAIERLLSGATPTAHLRLALN
jgi:hypothetical protein